MAPYIQCSLIWIKVEIYNLKVNALLLVSEAENPEEIGGLG